MVKKAWIPAWLFFSANFSFNAHAESANPNLILCEKAGTDIVICEEVAYRKERAGAIEGAYRELKIPAHRRPAITGPFEEAPGTIPAP